MRKPAVALTLILLVAGALAGCAGTSTHTAADETSAAPRVVVALGRLRRASPPARCPHVAIQRRTWVVVTSPSPTAAHGVTICSSATRSGAQVELDSRAGAALVVTGDGEQMTERPSSVLPGPLDSAMHRAVRRRNPTGGVVPPGGSLVVDVPTGGFLTVSRAPAILLAAAAWSALGTDGAPAGASSRFFDCIASSADGGVARAARIVSGCLRRTAATATAPLADAVASPSVTTALQAAYDGVATATYLTAVDAPFSDRGQRLLGLNLSPSHVGFGQVRPAEVDLGGDAGSRMTGISWSSWGGRRAVGTGAVSGTGPGRGGGRAGHEVATIVAFAPGTCQGHPAYRRVTWFFSQRGEHFDSAGGYRTCTPLGGFTHRTP